MLPENQKGVIQLGILGLIVLVAGLFAVTKLASNPNLTFFNIAEKAAGKQCRDLEEKECNGSCSPAGYKCELKKGECKTSSKKCEGKSESTSNKKSETKNENGGQNCGDGGTCRTDVKDCYEISGLYNMDGTCVRGFCCGGTPLSERKQGTSGGGGGGGVAPVCGNGKVEQGEDCDEQSNKCSNCKNVTPDGNGGGGGGGGGSSNNFLPICHEGSQCSPKPLGGGFQCQDDREDATKYCCEAGKVIKNGGCVVKPTPSCACSADNKHYECDRNGDGITDKTYTCDVGATCNRNTGCASLTPDTVNCPHGLKFCSDSDTISSCNPITGEAQARVSCSKVLGQGHVCAAKSDGDATCISQGSSQSSNVTNTTQPTDKCSRGITFCDSLLSAVKKCNPTSGIESVAQFCLPGTCVKQGDVATCK